MQLRKHTDPNQRRVRSFIFISLILKRKFFFGSEATVKLARANQDSAQFDAATSNFHRAGKEAQKQGNLSSELTHMFDTLDALKGHNKQGFEKQQAMAAAMPVELEGPGAPGGPAGSSSGAASSASEAHGKSLSEQSSEESKELAEKRIRDVVLKVEALYYGKKVAPFTSEERKCAQSLDALHERERDAIKNQARGRTGSFAEANMHWRFVLETAKEIEEEKSSKATPKRSRP